MQLYENRSYLLTTIDPVHVGTGGYRMDRLDNTIIRDVDGLPKIPGSSLSGAIRNYATLNAGKVCDDKKQCADCDICNIFGYTNDSASRKGLISFFDARILLFPIATMSGPMWLTTIPLCLEALGISASGDIPTILSQEYLPLSEKNKSQKVNLGWLLLSKATVQDEDVVTGIKNKLAENAQIKKILDKLIFIHPNIFSLVINDHLEVRTSVSIDPLTGAAVDGALFTYEAIPRSTVMWFDLVITDPKNYALTQEFEKTVTDTLDKSMNMLKYLGVGGMTTRGFGRVSIDKFEKSVPNEK